MFYKSLLEFVIAKS